MIGRQNMDVKSATRAPAELLRRILELKEHL
jgi:hypothetical protein